MRSVIHLSFFVPRFLPITDSAVWLIVSLMFSHININDNNKWFSNSDLKYLTHTFSYIYIVVT